MVTDKAGDCIVMSSKKNNVRHSFPVIPSAQAGIQLLWYDSPIRGRDMQGKGLISQVIPAQRLCHNYFFCHSVHAKRDTESSVSLVPGFHRDDVWIPAEVYPVPRYGAGMTVLKLRSPIATQSRRRESECS